LKIENFEIDLKCGHSAFFNFQSSLFNEALPLPLALLVALVLADHANNASAPDDRALTANFPY
jgi:hypothetical protein